LPRDEVALAESRKKSIEYYYDRPELISEIKSDAATQPRRLMPNRNFDVPEITLRELILHFSNKAEELGDKWFGAVNLNKLPYFSDSLNFIAFKRLGLPILRATYQKLSEGPAPRQFLTARKNLLNSEDIRLVLKPFCNYTQQRIVAIR
jgi:hypothetical protein